jgi:hypothetical protein
MACRNDGLPIDEEMTLDPQLFPSVEHYSAMYTQHQRQWKRARTQEAAINDVALV